MKRLICYLRGRFCCIIAARVFLFILYYNKDLLLDSKVSLYYNMDLLLDNWGLLYSVPSLSRCSCIALLTAKPQIMPLKFSIKHFLWVQFIST